MIVHHPANLQILYRYQPEAVYDAAGVLVREVLPSPRRTLVHAGHLFTLLSTGGRIFLLLGQRSLGFS
jgi:hypothetical protein